MNLFVRVGIAVANEAVSGRPFGIRNINRERVSCISAARHIFHAEWSDWIEVAGRHFDIANDKYIKIGRGITRLPAHRRAKPIAAKTGHLCQCWRRQC